MVKVCCSERTDQVRSIQGCREVQISWGRTSREGAMTVGVASIGLHGRHHVLCWIFHHQSKRRGRRRRDLQLWSSLEPHQKMGNSHIQSSYFSATATFVKDISGLVLSPYSCCFVYCSCCDVLFPLFMNLLKTRGNASCSFHLSFKIDKTHLQVIITLDNHTLL